MTIEQYAAEQGFSKITRYTLSNGSHVYRLENDDEGVSGLPFFAYETKAGWTFANPDETFKIMDDIY